MRTGRAVSRIPRVQGGGTHRSGQGAFGNMCRGGRMFAPTKTWRKWHAKINVTQKRYAVASAVAASGTGRFGPAGPQPQAAAAARPKAQTGKGRRRQTSCTRRASPRRRSLAAASSPEQYERLIAEHEVTAGTSDLVAAGLVALELLSQQGDWPLQMGDDGPLGIDGDGVREIGRAHV